MSLKDEITNDPLGIGYSAMTPREIEQSLTAVTRTKVSDVSRAWFSTWAAGNGMRAIIEDTAGTVGHPLRSIALACKDVLAGAADGIDLSLSHNRAMVGEWVQEGLMPQSDMDALIALATKPCSRADELGVVVNDIEVRAALGD